jgi:dihydrofolate reductase
MGKVYFDISMSLDGFITAADRTREEPLGRGGERLHDWAFNSQDEHNQHLVEHMVQAGGAVICGRRTYDDSMPWWGTDGPTGPARLPVFVVTHRPAADAPPGGVYTFVTDGIHRALEQAKAAAGHLHIDPIGRRFTASR